MKIALCNGGLGNQTFQYIFSRFVELDGGIPCYLDDSAFQGEWVEHNGFEMRRVFPNCRPRLLSECFTDDVWSYMMENVADGKSVIQQLKDIGEDYALVAETSDYRYDGNVIKVPVNQYLPWLSQACGNIYYHGYWINKNYLKNQWWGILREELQFAPLADDRNRRYEEQIEKTNSVSLHIRRGDFVKLNKHCSIENYGMVVKAIKESTVNPHFFIFSDDLPWCEQNREKMGLEPEEITFVTGNRGKDSYIDMQLMSYCKNAILLTPSSFSYLAVLLNRNESVMVVNGSGKEV